MIKVNNCIMITSQKDFDEYWNESWKKFDHATMREKPTEYPAFYIYNSPFDYHECGDWLKIDKIKFKLVIEKRIEEYKENINFLKKTLDKLN